MVEGSEKEETGYGISTKIVDNEHNILEVNVDNQTIKEVTEEGATVKEWSSFTDFIEEVIKEEIVDNLE